MVWMAVLCLGPLAWAQQAGGYRIDIPLEGLLTRQDNVESGKTLDLVALAGGEYTLSFSPLKTGKGAWVRAVLTKGEGFFGLCMLGERSSMEDVASLRVDIAAQEETCSFRFTAMPQERFLAVMELSLTLEGEYRLTPVAQAQGVAVTPLGEVTQQEPTQPAAQSAEPAAPQPAVLKLHPGTYALALLCLAAVLGIIVAGQMHWEQIADFFKHFGKNAAVLWGYITTRVKAPRSVEIDVQPQAPKGEEALPGLRVTNEAHGALVKQIVMRSSWEAAAEPAQREIPEQVNDYFLGRARLPAQANFLTVGLRNRDALQQLGGHAVSPLLAPNPRGQIFSLEEETGGLYLHVDYFAPPSFVLQSVLRSVCLECLFLLEDEQGRPLRLEDVFNHTITGISPALTARTQDGFIVTQKGRLVVGSI